MSIKARKRACEFAALAIVVLAGALLLFLVAYNSFQWYDDEGMMMVTVHDYLAGGLHSAIGYSTYGPFESLWNGWIFSLQGMGLSHNTSRSVAAVHYLLGNCLLLGFVWRMTKSYLVAMLAFLQVVHNSLLLCSEPMHPQQTIFLFSCLLIYLSSFRLERTVVACLAGVCISAISLTKINAGGLTAMAAAMAFLPALSQLAGLSKRAILAIALLFSLAPLVLMNEYIVKTPMSWWAWLAEDQYSFHGLCLVVLFGLVACSLQFTHVAVKIGRPGRFVGAVTASALCAALGLLIYFYAHGLSWMELLSSIVLRAVAHKNIANAPPFDIGRKAAFVSAMAAGAAAVYALRARKSTRLLDLSLGALMLAAGFIGLTQGMRWPLPKAVESLLLYVEGAWFFTGIPWFWLLLVPLRRNGKGPLPVSYPTLFVAFLGTLQLLYSYPVARTQLHFSAAMGVAGAALMLSKGAWMVRRSLSRTTLGNMKWPCRRRVLMPLVAAAVLLTGAYFLLSPHVFSSVGELLRARESRIPGRHLQGASMISMARGEYARYGAIVQNVLAYGDSVELGARLKSVFFWAGRPPTTTLPRLPHWPFLVPLEEDQRKWIDAIEALDNPVVVTRKIHGQPNIFAKGKRLSMTVEYDGSKTFLGRYYYENYEELFDFGHDYLFVEKGRFVAERPPRYLLWGPYSFSEPADTLPIPNIEGNFPYENTGLRLVFRTRSSGVMLGLQDSAAWQGPSLPENFAYNPVAYVGTDGLLRVQLLRFDKVGAAIDPVDPISSVAPCNDGKWHTLLFLFYEDGQAAFLDGNLLGTITHAPSSAYRALPYAQVGSGAWGEWPGASPQTWSVLQGELKRAAVWACVETDYMSEYRRMTALLERIESRWSQAVSR